MGITRAEEIEHGSVSVEQQALLGRQSTTAKVGNEVRGEKGVSELPKRKGTRDNWTKEENRKLWECYLRSKPDERGYRKRMHELWEKEVMKEMREQQLCDQTSQIEEKDWLEELELKAIRRKIEGECH